MIKTFILCLLTTFSITFAQIPIPPIPTSRVTDITGTLSQETKTRLNTMLEALEKKNGSQVLVYMDYTLKGMPIEDFGIKSARAWKPGQAKDNNGVILFVFKTDRKMRIEVGRGLEASLTDTTTKAILDDVIRPKFKTGDFDGGIKSGVEAIVTIAAGQPWTPPNNSGIGHTILFILCGFVVLTIVIAFVSKGNIILPILLLEILSGSNTSSSGFGSGGGNFDGGGSSSDW